MSDPPSRNAYRLISGMLELVAASCFLTDFLFFAIRFGNAYLDFEGILLLCLTLVAGLFALVGGILALGRRRPKLERIVLFTAIFFALVLVLSIWMYGYLWQEQSVQGLILLALSTLVLAVSRSKEDESETQIYPDASRS